MLDSDSVIEIEGVGNRKLGSRIGTGGQARVFEWLGEPDYVIKVFSKATPDIQRRLQYMIAHPPKTCDSGGHTYLAWPQHIVSHRGRCVGYTMARAQDAVGNLTLLRTDKLRSERWPEISWAAYVAVAANIANVFVRLHEKDYAVIDAKHENIMVTNEFEVTIIDTDSFQIDGKTDGFFAAPVTTPDYTDFRMEQIKIAARAKGIQSRFEVAHDIFPLAAVLYQLLFADSKPFAGKWVKKFPSDPPRTVAEATKENEYVRKAGSGFSPPRSCPPYEILPARLRRLFDRAFGDGLHDLAKRPTAYEFFEELRLLYGLLVPCHRFPTVHFYHPEYKNTKGQRVCPWCEMLKLGVAVFPDSAQRSGTKSPINVKAAQASFRPISSSGTVPPRPASPAGTKQTNPPVGTNPSQPVSAVATKRSNPPIGTRSPLPLPVMLREMAVVAAITGIFFGGARWLLAGTLGGVSTTGPAIASPEYSNISWVAQSSTVLACFVVVGVMIRVLWTWDKRR